MADGSFSTPGDNPARSRAFAARRSQAELERTVRDANDLAAPFGQERPARRLARPPSPESTKQRVIDWLGWLCGTAIVFGAAAHVAPAYFAAETERLTASARVQLGVTEALASAADPLAMGCALAINLDATKSAPSSAWWDVREPCTAALEARAQ